MDILKVSGVKIAGVVACLPEHIKDNRETMGGLFPEDALNTVIKATGINKRTIAENGTTSLDLGVLSALNLLENTNTKAEDIGGVICVTFTPEYNMPADATGAQARLGIPNSSLAFDINMACSGYGYGLYFAATIVKALNKKVLLLNGDIQSAFLSGLDKGTAPVMADIGTATLLEPDSESKTWSFSFYTDGSRRDKLFIPAGGSKNPIKNEDLEYITYEDGSKRRGADIYMDGFEIFKFVAQDASKFIKEFMDKIELSPDEIDGFIPHQANIYMINQLGKKLKFSNDKIWKSGDEFGNPSSASIPLTIAHNANKSFTNSKSGRFLISGFGGGLSISVADIELTKGAFYNLIQKRKGGLTYEQFS